jgi:hypothetical protein
MHENGDTIMNKKIISSLFFRKLIISKCTPKLLDRHNYESKGENNERIMNWAMLLGSQHFKGRKVYWSSRMGTRMNDKWVNYSH